MLLDTLSLCVRSYLIVMKRLEEAYNVSTGMALDFYDCWLSCDEVIVESSYEVLWEMDMYVCGAQGVRCRSMFWTSD